MKVMCIGENPAPWRDLQGNLLNQKYPHPKDGEVCVVTDERVVNNDTFYQLAGYDPYLYYLSIYFIPLSSIDETELVKEREPNTVAI